ncbi:hypothetical protein EYF80_033297 [Liparis tanakae]|uniref:Uncharacterized protein n=1 Tax=Liparis tanakae TaxID=230148 RepID=A0A4Z2GTC2_9TELE|nr:hypothetical protein EYF80_033297 [Liparis tanakae]
MISVALHKWMRSIPPEMLLLVQILLFLPLTGAAPSLTNEQLDTGVTPPLAEMPVRPTFGRSEADAVLSPDLI